MQTKALQILGRMHCLDILHGFGRFGWNLYGGFLEKNRRLVQVMGDSLSTGWPSILAVLEDSATRSDADAGRVVRLGHECLEAVVAEFLPLLPRPLLRRALHIEACFVMQVRRASFQSFGERRHPTPWLDNRIAIEQFRIFHVIFGAVARNFSTMAHLCPTILPREEGLPR